MLNNKGFTLVELLAVVVLLAIVMGVTASIGINIYNNSKIKAEALFIEQLNKSIDNYIALSNTSFTFTYRGTRNKCGPGGTGTCSIKYYTAKNGSSWVTFSDIISSGIISQKDFVNPFDSTPCAESANIEIFKDEDEVYSYRYKLVCIKNDVNKNGAYVYSNVWF